MSARAGEAKVRVAQRERGVLDSHVAPDQSARIARSRPASESTELGFIPSASSGRSPAPIPRIIRPPEISSTVAAAAAVIARVARERVRDRRAQRSREEAVAASVRYA